MLRLSMARLKRFALFSMMHIYDLESKLKRWSGTSSTFLVLLKIVFLSGSFVNPVACCHLKAKDTEREIKGGHSISKFSRHQPVRLMAFHSLAQAKSASPSFRRNMDACRNHQQNPWVSLQRPTAQIKASRFFIWHWMKRHSEEFAQRRFFCLTSVLHSVPTACCLLPCECAEDMWAKLKC